MKWVAFDLETTGLKWEEGHRVIEFCFIELDADLQEIGRWSRLVNPGREIPTEIQEITSITNEMVADKPGFENYAARIQKLVADATLIAHNHRFDITFLHHELLKAGQPGLAPTHPAIDTMEIEGLLHSRSLAACYERYIGTPIEDAHRSEADTVAMVEVLRKQREVHAGALPDDLADLQTDKLRTHFHPDRTSRTWLDHGHKFYQDGDGKTRFGFGKYRDEVVDRLNTDHRGYLDWMRNRDFGQDTLDVVNSLTADPQQKLA